MITEPGRIVRIISFSDTGASTEAFWWAAIGDDAAAVTAVASQARATADDGVTVIGEISTQELEKAGLKSGQAAPAPRPNAP